MCHSPLFFGAWLFCYVFARFVFWGFTYNVRQRQVCGIMVAQRLVSYRIINGVYTRLILNRNFTFLWGCTNRGFFAMFFIQRASGLGIAGLQTNVGGFLGFLKMGVFTSTGCRVLGASYCTMITIIILTDGITHVGPTILISDLDNDLQRFVVTLRCVVSTNSGFTVGAIFTIFAYFKICGFAFSVYGYATSNFNAGD